MYENDSYDKTKKEIKQFYENRSGKYLCESVPNSKMMSGISMDRGLTMAKFRNKLKKYHGRLRSDFVLLLNCDTVFLPSSIMEMINNILTSRETAMVTGYPMCFGSYIQENETNHYYDSLALITENNISYIENGNSCIFSKCARCKIHRSANGINIEDSSLLNPKNIINVKSAFGGLALIKTNIYNIVEWGESICEHHSFCKNIHKFGNVVINPSIKFFTTKKIYSLRYKVIQRILKNIINNDILIKKKIENNDDDEESDDSEYSSDEFNDVEDEINNMIKNKKPEEEKVKIILDNDSDNEELLKKTEEQKTKVVIKNSLFDELYNLQKINRFEENSNKTEETIIEISMPIEEQCEEVKISIPIEEEIITLLDDDEIFIENKKVANINPFQYTSEKIETNIAFPNFSLKVPENIKIIPNLYE